MANTFTANSEHVMGNTRMRTGTLTMTDGAAGSSVASGLDSIYAAVLNPKTAGSLSQYPPTNVAINSNVKGDFKAVSAGSGDTYYATVWGSA
jgi:hypothetical protein